MYRAKLGKQLSIKYGKFQAGVLFPWMKSEREKLAKKLRNKCSLLRFNTGGGGGIILGQMSRFLFEKSNNCKGDSYSTFECIQKLIFKIDESENLRRLFQ